MPFLKKDILLGILKTYPGSKAIEEKIKNIEKQSKKSFWEFGLKYLLSMGKKLVNHNTPEFSEFCYLKIKAYIELADTYPEYWPDLLCTAGEAGTRTQASSSEGSKSELCEAAFALISYIIKQVNEKVASIPKNAPPSDEEMMALKINEFIKARIETEKNLIELQKVCLDYYEILYTRDGLSINTENIAGNEAAALKMIATTQRNLYFLGDDSLQKDKRIDPRLQTPEQLFINMDFYNPSDKKKYNLSVQKSSELKFHLPMYLQDVWIIIHIRNKRPNLKNDGEDTVIGTFEKEFISRGEEEKTQTLSHKRKDPLLPLSPFSDLKYELPPASVPRLRSLNSKDIKSLEVLKSQQGKLHLLEETKPKEIHPPEKLALEDHKENKIIPAESNVEQKPLSQNKTPQDTKQSFFSVQEVNDSASKTPKSTSKMLTDLNKKENPGSSEKTNVLSVKTDDMNPGKKQQKNKHKKNKINKIETLSSQTNLRMK